MGRKKITNLFPDYIRTGKADLEALSQLVLSAKGSRSMNDFANDCEVNTSTISRIINMKNTTACSDEVLVAISKAADPASGVTLEKLLAANGMVKLVPAGTEGEYIAPSEVILKMSEAIQKNEVDDIEKSSKAFMQSVARFFVESKLEENCREALQNSLLLGGYSVELIASECMVWPENKTYRADFAIKTNALKDEGIDTWLFDCKSYNAGMGMGTVGKMTRLFGMAYTDSPREHGVKVSIVVDHSAMFQEAKRQYGTCKIRDYFSFILINSRDRRVVDEFCIPRIDGTEKSVFKVQDGR